MDNQDSESDIADNNQINDMIDLVKGKNPIKDNTEIASVNEIPKDITNTPKSFTPVPPKKSKEK
ncbi:MAG: hypothetical protein JW712_12195 [Dehalococcoidales bacterium]|nr:hypothetical protein [Dehalococcoidales bacterium]